MNFNPFKKIFIDGSGTYTGFKWWFRWTVAAYHWRKWLEYEGMPRHLKTPKEMHDWNKQLINKQNV